jgi:hypothetical protein
MNTYKMNKKNTLIEKLLNGACRWKKSPNWANDCESFAASIHRVYEPKPTIKSNMDIDT